MADLVLDARADLGEGPRWDADAGVLEWLDVTRGLWHRMTPAGRVVASQRLGERVSCVRPRRGGGWVAAVDGAVVLLDRDGFEERPGDPAGDGAAASSPGGTGVASRRRVVPMVPGAVLNDGGCDAAGRLLVGSVAPDPAAGALHRVDPDGTVTTLRGGIAMSNGLDWSPDGRRLFHVDSAAGTVTACDYDLDGECGGVVGVGRGVAGVDGLPGDGGGVAGVASVGGSGDGTVGAAHVLIRVPPDEGMPDGLAVDDAGALWVAIWGAGEVRRYTPDGRLDGRVRVPASQVTSCALGGGRLWITTARQGLSTHALERQPLAGAVFACDVPVGPTAPQRFAG